VLTVREILYGRKGVRVREEHEPYLAAVKRAANELEASRDSFATALRAAHDADVPLRAIAAAAGVSHEQVRRLVRTS
jgi:hypothetical protein